MFPFLALLTLFTLTKAMPQAASPNDCVGTISSLEDVNAAVQCKTVNISPFTVPAGETFSLQLTQSTVVNVLGDIQFGNATWPGPLFEVTGQDITFNGNGHIWNGNGPFYWDGLGSGGDDIKPSPMMAVYISGTFRDVHVVNSPERCFAISSTGPLVVSGTTVDNSEGQYPNAKSEGLPAGRNTDGFDVCGNDIIIEKSTVVNQDDCLAINSGRNITFQDNYCEDGHGISIGSISSNTVVESVLIRENRVVNSAIAFRIKTDKTATNSRVSNVIYQDNTAVNCTEYGVLFTQSYPAALGMPGDGVTISGVDFNGLNDVSVASGADMVAVNCGSNTCTGKWKWEGLKTSGGKDGPMNNIPEVSGYFQ